MNPIGNKPRGGTSEEKPFVWMTKHAVERIQREAGTRAPMAFATYLALAILASRQGNDPVINEPIAKIAGTVGLGYRACFEYLKFLDDVGLIKMTSHPRAKGKSATMRQLPNTIVLLSTQTARRAVPRLHMNPDSDAENGTKRNNKETHPAGGGGLNSPTTPAGEGKQHGANRVRTGEF